jgi:hypothetical protein
MIERQPIILNCFSRGGSNILWNIFLSLAPQAMRFIDRILHVWKMKTLEDDEMRFKAEGQLYTVKEVEQARLAMKNNNGLIFLSEQFHAMYPDATFIALTRHPVPLYESHKRRKTPLGRSPERFARFYNAMIRQMQMDAQRLPRYHIVRFEDILVDPAGQTRRLYEWADLDFERLNGRLRFKAKPHMQSDGRHVTSFIPGRHYWFALSDVHRILDPRINQYQSHHLSEEERRQVSELTRTTREWLGYDEA